MPVTASLDRFKRPEYTGENRCVPCTIVNVAIAIVLGGGVAAGTGWFLAAPFIGAVSGTSIIVVSLVVIYLRGFLVPGTPWFTERYLPDRVLTRFDKLGVAPSVDERLDAEGLLLFAGVVEECEDEDDLCLTEEFDAAWSARIDERTSMEVSRGDLAELLSVEAADLSIDRFEDALVAHYGGRRIGQWESDASFIADMAAASVLSEQVPEWSSIDVRERSGLLAGLRVFLESCPSCGGALSMGESVVESCCRSVDVVTIECTVCEGRLLETAAPD